MNSAADRSDELGTAQRRPRLDPPHNSPAAPHVESAQSPTVDEIIDWIRQELARNVNTDDPTSAPQIHCPPTHEPRWNRIRANLNLAEQNAHAGMLVPELGRFHGWTRSLARQAARAILILARVVTNSQRKFNIGILGAVRDLYCFLRHAEHVQHELAAMTHRLERLEHEHAELKARLSPNNHLLPSAHVDTRLNQSA